MGLDSPTDGYDIMVVTLKNKGGNMDELSWKVRLAKASINITNITEDTWYYEFPFHPKAGQTKWCKTFSKIGVGKTLGGTEKMPYQIPLPMTDAQMASKICEDVLEMRKRLED